MSKEAMKLALDALGASQKFTEACADGKVQSGLGDQLYDKAIATLSEAMEQPQQEPVGIVTTDCQEGPALIEAYQPIKAGTTIYTSPPARKPLTDDQWHGVAMQAREAFFGCKQDNVLGQIDCAAHAAMRATEAAYGIKEN